MEQDRFPTGGSDPGLYGSDRDVFSRVWRRVMPEDREDCPIEVQPKEIMPIAVQNPPATYAPMLAETQEKNSPANGMACLGAGSAVYGEQLQEFITDELMDHRYYNALVKWAGAGAARLFSCIAADEYRHAKRLSAAYFLISGVHYCPENLPAPVINNYLGSLRRRFAAEQEGSAAYLAAAATTSDECLHEMYLEFAEDEANHSRLIRSILERQL